jgi:hypothetical protein
MADRERKGDEGYGDDQGTRVGSPTPSGRENEGNERERGTGAGAEGARGIHEQGSGDETGRAGGPTGESGDAERAGSEPLRGRQREHVSGYGGAGDRPKTSSDQREPLDPEGGAEVE